MKQQFTILGKKFNVNPTCSLPTQTQNCIVSYFVMMENFHSPCPMAKCLLYCLHYCTVCCLMFCQLLNCSIIIALSIGWCSDHCVIFVWNYYCIYLFALHAALSLHQEIGQQTTNHKVLFNVMHQHQPKVNSCEHNSKAIKLFWFWEGNHTSHSHFDVLTSAKAS